MSSVTFINVFITSKNVKTAFVNLNTLYDNFLFKKELEKKLIKTQEERQFVLDKIKDKLDSCINKLEASIKKSESDIMTYKQLQDEYYLKEKSLSDDRIAQASEYDKQVWLQINQFIKDYGVKQGYTYIYGATGSGNIMYADSTSNITDEVTIFINNMYESKEE